MSNRSKGVRLWLRKGKGNIQSAWIIRDGPKQIRTGCGYDESEEAERRLSSYINEKYRPERQRNRDPSRILIADVLNIYAEDISSKIRRPTELGQRIIALLSFSKMSRLISCDIQQLHGQCRPVLIHTPQRTFSACHLIFYNACMGITIPSIKGLSVKL